MFDSIRLWSHLVLDFCCMFLIVIQFTNCNWSIQILYLFIIQCWKIVLLVMNSPLSISSFVYFFSFLVFSWWVWIKVDQFYLPFQRTSFGFIDLIGFFVSISFISTLIFIISFFLLTLGLFAPLFLAPLDVSLDYLRFFLFFEVGLNCYKLPF